MKEEHLISRVGVLEMINHFGKNFKEWEIAKQYNPDTDEIWAWDSGGWQKLSGRAGYILIRNGEILEDTIKLTKMS